MILTQIFNLESEAWYLQYQAERKKSFLVNFKTKELSNLCLWPSTWDAKKRALPTSLRQAWAKNKIPISYRNQKEKEETEEGEVGEEEEERGRTI